MSAFPDLWWVSVSSFKSVSINDSIEGALSVRKSRLDLVRNTASLWLAQGFPEVHRG